MHAAICGAVQEKRGQAERTDEVADAHAHLRVLVQEQLAHGAVELRLVQQLVVVCHRGARGAAAARDLGHARHLADDEQHALEHDGRAAVAEHLLDERRLEHAHLHFGDPVSGAEIRERSAGVSTPTCT